MVHISFVSWSLTKKQHQNFNTQAPGGAFNSTLWSAIIKIIKKKTSETIFSLQQQPVVTSTRLHVDLTKILGKLGRNQHKPNVNNSPDIYRWDENTCHLVADAHNCDLTTSRHTNAHITMANIDPDQNNPNISATPINHISNLPLKCQLKGDTTIT